jgi:hypothetical protein
MLNPEHMSGLQKGWGEVLDATKAVAERGRQK